MNIVTETDRLVLRTWEPEDAAAAFLLWGDPEVMRFVGTPLDSVEAAGSALRRGIAAQERFGFCLWAVAEKATASVIGCCGFHPVDDDAALELVYHFIPCRWRQGFATEAAAACVTIAFGKLNRRRLVAYTQPGNSASERVLRKLGFSYKGMVEYQGSLERLHELQR